MLTFRVTNLIVASEINSIHLILKRTFFIRKNEIIQNININMTRIQVDIHADIVLRQFQG